MKIDLTKYAFDRLREKEQQIKCGLPVITISREFGCPAKEIARKLVTTINRFTGKDEWDWISKEILERSAKELDVKPEEIKYVFEYEVKGIFDEILAAQSKKYHRSDKKIRKSIANVIKAIANDGNVVIVGRGGVAITRDCPNAFHVKLQAPLDWRVKGVVSRRENMSYDEGVKYTVDFDKKRKRFLDYYWGGESDNSIFDAIYNCSTMSVEEIAESLILILKMRELIKPKTPIH